MEKLVNYLEEKSSEVSGAYFLTDFTSGDTFGNKGTNYYIASCAKSVLGRILFKISLKEDIENLFNEYLKETLKKINSISIFDFLTHSVELIDYLDVHDINHGLTNDLVIKEFFSNTSPLKRTSFEYGNTSYVILADFINKNWGFQKELKKLNCASAEELKIFPESLVVQSFGKENTKLVGKDNRTYGDGGIVFCPSESKPPLSSFLVQYINEIKANQEQFFSHAKSIEESLSYSYGVFIEKQNNGEFRIFHSGYYGGFIAFWSITSAKHGFSLVLNHDNIEKEVIESFC
ncbi:MAG: hypothetical protein NXH75_07160 [Halobacteriovoraceae bacterium]|nr:hypothetical protein [Halobacteriovoraceae bacterium]